MRVECFENMLQALKSQIALRNLALVDEKYFYGRYLLPKQGIGSWIAPGGDNERLQIPRRLYSEKKFLVFFAVTLTGVHYYKVCNKNISSENYIEFIKEMANHLALNANIQMENMSLIQDNAKPHVARKTLNFLADKNVRLIKQPPYFSSTGIIA